jgi:enoyl-CoA hydratase/carnithine racemase
MDTYEHILYERFDGVLRITLNRPESLNAISQGPGSMQEELNRAFASADADNDVRCVLLTGSGRAFCSGADTSQIAEAAGEPSTAWDTYRSQERGNRENEQIRTLSKPVVAAVNGICYGGGLILACHCDLRVAADNARFSMIEGRMGMSGAETLPFLVGDQWAKFLIWTGEPISARRAKEIGLVLEVVPADDLIEKTMDLATRIASVPKFGVMLNKRNINGAMDLMGWGNNKLFSVSHTTITETLVPLAATPDGRNLEALLADEGFAAFKKARDAAFATPWLTEPDS